MSRRAFTLVELLVVLLILAAVAGVAVTMTAGQGQDAAQKATDVSLVRIREAILGGAEGPGYSSDRADGALPSKIADLILNPATGDSTQTWDPVTKLGWRGPYLRGQGVRYGGAFGPSYGTNDDPALLDGWGRPIVLQIPTAMADPDLSDRLQHARLVSAGPDGELDCDADVLLPSKASRDDDRVLFLQVPDP